MRTVAPDTLRVVLETKDAPLRASVTRALAPERVRIRTIDAPEGTNAPDERPDGLIVDASLDVPGLLETARREGWLGRSTPVFALMDDPLPRETQLEWLGTGVWEFVRLPLDGELFALRLRNLLRARSTGVDSGEPYGWAALRRVADESVALARRFGRPLTVVGFGLDWKQPLDDETRDLLRRLATSAGERIRRSDLLGLSPEGSLLILLPDSDATGAGIFQERMNELLDGLLRDWGVAARLLSSLVALESSDAETGDTLLRAAVETLD